MIMNIFKMLRLLLIFVMHCLLTNGQGPGPGPGHLIQGRLLNYENNPPQSRNNMHSRSADKRVRFSVLEGQDAGTFVGTIPLKTGYTYRFNESPKEFLLNGTSGEIRTTKILDREALKSDIFDLVILSSQPTYPIEVSIVVIDINDNAPRFPEPSIHVTFSENANAGTRVILDTATDGDARENDVTTNYKIVSGNNDNKFRLVVTTNPSGETPYLHLETTERLDRETVESYKLNISAEDGGSPPRFGFLVVNVSVLDVNDNSPTFDHSDYIVSLSESIPPGTSILQVKATDIDVGENSKLSYYLSDTETQFSVDIETGVITTVEPLSCHRNCPQRVQCPKSCVFTVFARDHGSPRQDGRTYVTVNLQDANDHNPIVSFRYFSATAEFASVDENAQNGSVVAVVSVIDADEGLNGETIAEIRGGNDLNHFRLDSKDSFDIVRVNGILDREKLSKYNVTIVATDKGTPTRSSTAFLIIHVNDINDHEPVFEKSEYSAILSELVPVGSYVAGITANDEDTGVNSNIFYDITSGNDRQWFTINRKSGLITTKAHLDREIQDSIDLKISARDGGPNPKRAYTYLKITILDENDEKPVFSESVMNITLSESTRKNVLVAQVSAVDRDRGTNGSISYHFHEDVEYNYPRTFHLDSSSGRVTTIAELDRETIPIYAIQIIAKDQGNPPLSSTATIYLTLVDVNDNSPVFYPQKYFIVVPEDLPLSSTVAQVRATDKDVGPNAVISYKLISSDDNNNTFEIDSYSGILRLRGRLSRVKKPRYRLFVNAKDQGERKADTNAVIDIVIENTDIKPSSFEIKGGYKFMIVENVDENDLIINNEVGQVVLDTALKTEIVTYSIVSGDPENNFKIDSHTGAIKTIKRTDREQTAAYELKIVATTPSTYGMTWVNITVEDRNDNPPKFPVDKAKAYVAENRPIGHQVYLARAFDSDDGRNSHITYSLSKNKEDTFYISKSTGMIYLKKAVKYGISNEFDLEVTATDSGIPSLSSKQMVTIYIEDVNDHTPIFEHESYETSLLESTPVNDRFFALTASDKDDGKNGLISYAITDGNDDNKFGIFPDGYMYVKSALDRESRDYFALTIIAADHGDPPRTSTVSLVIHILDENDNAPKFTNSTFTFYLDENEPPDTYVGRLTATDLDKGRNAELTYKIAINQVGFIVDPKNGFVKTLHYFDREKLIQMTGQDFIAMEGVVYDNGVNKLNDKTKIIVYISDVNDNPPKFIKKYHRAEISEGASLNTHVTRITATDQDEGLNGNIFYSISAGNENKYFHLDELTGHLTLARLLDRETTSTYHLEITAADFGSPVAMTAMTTLIVDVLDENDNAPNFIISDSEISVPENTEVNTVLHQFRATDSDLRMNQEISYILAGGNIHETFHIDTKTGTLLLDRPLDFEQRNIYHLNVTASDKGTPRLTSSVSFIIRILDYNDNPPIFPNTAIVRQIQEGILPNTIIVTVTAVDPDSGANGQIKYTISQQYPPGNHFIIDEDSGVVKTVKDIDREFTDTFKLTVVATDQAIDEPNRLKSEKTVTVIVEDINDNAPLIISMNAGILPVDASPGYEIIKIVARDRDANSNGHVTFDLIDGSTNIFALERNGSLRLKQKLMSSKILYQVKVRATDEAVKQHIQYLDENVTILVHDPSHEGPQFSKNSYFGTVMEGSSVGTSIVTVNAKLSSNSKMKIAYHVVNVTSIEGHPMDRAFDIKQNNVVSTATILDREDGPNQYIVTVAAVVVQGNTPRMSTTQIKVTVLDKNDSPPLFGPEPHHFEISEDLLAGRKIGNIKATDPDTLGTLTYSLVSGDDGKFNLDPSSGDLTLRKTLDRETKSFFQVVVSVDDGEQQTTTTVTIKVLDTNDNPPLFPEAAYSFDIPEDSERGSKVGVVSATDADEGSNGHISYTVMSEWGNDVFSLNPQTGVFTLTSRLDYEQVQHYIFVVQAQDTGGPPLSSTVTVYFNVQDLNDNAPVFDPMSYSDEILENITTSSSVLTVSATDQDSGMNGKISYSIAGGDDKNQFSINENGTIMTRSPLDREDQSFYNLIVVATDRAQPQDQRLSSSVQVTIILRDVNDMSPEFVTSNETSVAENTPLNTVIMAIKAIDRDEGRNSYIEYSLEGQPQSTFMLGSADGLLRIVGDLDREEQANYSLVVTARDRGTPPNSRTLTINLRVTDENDNAPIFDPKQYSSSVPENASIGLSVLQVSATDADEGLNGRVRYTIVAGDKNRDFIISEDTGVIRVAKNLNYERRNHYLLTVQAEDSGTDIRYDSSTVTISIMDINDNAPVFLDSPYLIYVMENMVGLPRPIATSVTAFDADNSPYNTVSYLLKEGDKSVFSVNSSSGEITLLKALDREQQDHFTLMVIAMDTGTPRLTGTGTISVLVQDENDHSPSFPNDHYDVTVNENLRPGTPILTIPATDKDEGVNALIRYTLIGGASDMFKVNSETGMIITKEVLDREVMSEYFLVLEARDSSLTDSKSATTKVSIKVLDENDNTPEFESKESTVIIPYPTKTGDFVFGDAAYDNDVDENGRIIYHLSGDDASKFDLDQLNGIIKTSTPLEKERVYEVTLGAQDFGSPPLSSFMKLKIHLQPSELFPVFHPVQKTYSFRENVKNAIVAKVQAHSPKNGLARNIKYDIAGGNTDHAFVINENTGRLMISSSGIDYETLPQYHLYISASDDDLLPLSSIIHLVVNVSDYNDNKPIFAQSIYNTSLLEDLYPPQLIATVSASDKDSETNAELSYRFKEDRISDVFSLDNMTGKIYTKITLKREEIERYEFFVEAIDRGSPAQTGSAMVIVNVQDKNNNPPRFTRLFSVNVTENAEVGTFVIQVTSSDRDIGENANVTYSFTKNPDNKFFIDPISGNVTVIDSIDREIRDEYFLKVSASDGSWKAETPLTITVQDENDNAPLFEKQLYEFNFPEMQRSVAFVGHVKAYDKDKQGPNSALSYSLKFPSDFFSVDSISGEILSKQALKYKHTLKNPSPENQYHLTVVATDNGKPPMSSETSIVINVVDANNNQPQFTKNKYFSPVLEDATIGDNVIQIEAIDERDYGVNAQIVYEILSGNGTTYFSVDSQTGWIKVHRKLNNKIGNHYTLIAKAKDSGVPPLHDEVVISLVITGENKFAPKFTASSYQVIIAENEEIGSTIGTVKAFDKDEGPNGMVRYSFASGNDDGKFHIGKISGSVTIYHALDFDTVKVYELNITAHDLAFEPQYSVAVFTVLLTDVNDNPPKFDSNEYNANIDENSPVGTSVFQLSATDVDSTQNAMIQFSIVGGDGRQFFSVHSKSGIISSRKVFDFEQKKLHILNVVAANPDSKQMNSAVLKIHVTGRNEYFPKFIQPVFQFTISESARIGATVGSIQATDEDLGDDGIVYYLLVGSSNDRGFQIQPSTGVLTISRNLDRERQNRVVLTVMAKNAGSIRGNDTDEAQIIISIQDGNDPPVFERPFYKTRLSEAAKIGTEMYSVKAIDSDVRPQNNQFTYTIMGGNIGRVFKVDPQTGVIKTTAQLDRESVQVYNLTVGAIDNGSPSQTGTALVQVVIDDINDNGPRFDPQNIIGYVAENEPIMTSVMTLSAVDPDLPPNTKPFSYYIIGGEHMEFFSLDENTGEVKTTRSIDRETTPELNFRIEVHDSGKPRMKSEYPVSIVIIDKNDSPSTPRTVTVKVMTLHGYFPGGKLADVHPNDVDTSGQYSCQILASDSSVFSLPNACNLHATRGNHDHSYSLSIIGNDGRYSNVTSKVMLDFETFENVSLENSIIFRIMNVKPERFLRLYYTSFVETVSRLFTKEVLYIYSISGADLHTDLTIAAESLSSDDFLKPHHIAKTLNDNSETLFQTLQGLEFAINYNPCDENPCENNGRCSNKIHAFDEMEITDSPSLILTTPLIKNDILCDCQKGFTGEYCQLRQDPCSPNPCAFGGTCARRGFDFTCTCPPSRQGSTCEVDKTNACDQNPCRNGGSCQTTLEGGFFCLCRPGFRGNQCELESESCRPNPCQNGGSCVPLRPGYKCSCLHNYYGMHCEKSTFSFEELSFMKFPTLDSTTNDISIVFSTNKPDSLLVYNYGIQTGGRSDFVAIEITGGKPRFSYGGARTEITYVTVDQNVADGKWHKVTATRNGRVISLSVSECLTIGEGCTECKPGNRKCYADAVGLTGTLNLNNEPMYLGGVMTVDPIQERPNQVFADDFVGCIQSVSINGRPLNLSESIQQRGISNTCRRIANVCNGNPCGDGSQCLDRWSTYMCICPNGLLAPNCDSSLEPITFNGDSFVEFKITEQHRRRQLMPQLYHKHVRWARDSPLNKERLSRSLKIISRLRSSPPKILSFQFRTLESNGVLLHSATNTDYTMVEIRNGQLRYSSKLGANKPMNMTLTEPGESNDGNWHNLTLLSAEHSLVILLDGDVVAEELEITSVHDFLDAYLTSLTLGDAPYFTEDLPYQLQGFSGCMATLSVNGEVQPFNASSSSVLSATPHRINFLPDCATFIGSAAATDPISVGITLVIVFFILLLVAIFISFVAYRFRRQKKEKVGGHVFQNGSALLANTSSDSGRTHQDSGFVESAEMTDDVLRSHLTQELTAKKYKDRDHDRPQRPDIIEREVINKSPGVPLRVSDDPHGDRSGLVGLCRVDSEQPEHYDLENASSIAPSDIDIVYHYKGYRDGNIRKYKTNPHVPAYHKHSHRHSPHNFPNAPHRESPRNILRQSPNHIVQRDSPSVLKMQSTPLARLSPSSELSQQTPRILTLQDLSGKPLQTALLATSQGPGVKDVMSNSERSLNSPVSHLSQSSGSIHVSQSAKKKKLHDNSVGLGLTAEEIDRLNSRTRNSSLLTTLDAVSSSSESHQRKEKLADLLEANTELLEAPDSSTDESGNDSFTCSEFEYDNNYEKVTRDFGPGTMIFSKLAEVDNENDHDNESSKNYDGFDSFRGSLSTLVASDDDLSNISSYKPPNGSTFGWDNLLNWGPNYESLVGVFKDIAELPDSGTNGRVSNRGTPKISEEYV